MGHPRRRHGRGHRYKNIRAGKKRPLVIHCAQARLSPWKAMKSLAFLAQRVAKWWIPDGVIFLDSLPVGGTGKVQ